MKLNTNMKRHSVPHVMLFPMESSFVNFKIFSFSGRKPWTITPWCEFWESTKSLEKMIPSERASQGEQNGANFSIIAPSEKGKQNGAYLPERSYECSKILTHSGDDLYHVHTFAIDGTHNSSLEGAMKLKFAPFCSS